MSNQNPTFDRPRTNWFCPECGAHALRGCNCEPDDDNDHSYDAWAERQMGKEKDDE